MHDSLAHRIAVGFGDAHRGLGRLFDELQAGFLAGPENPRIGSIIGIGFRGLLSLGLEHDVHAAVVSQPGGPLVAPHPLCRFGGIGGLWHLTFFMSSCHSLPIARMAIKSAERPWTSR